MLSDIVFSEVMFSGISIGIIELGLFYVIIRFMSKFIRTYVSLDFISYAWLSLTLLTGIWEFCFIVLYSEINNISGILIEHKKHVWLSGYDISYLLPWKFSKIFYAEYGAYADREYMARDNIWSRIIEGTHAILCGVISGTALYYLYPKRRENKNKIIIYINVAMGAQLMNSLLYIGNYLIEINDVNNVNYNSEVFPCGFILTKRPFMYVNIFWTIMPCYVIYMQLSRTRKKIK
jgi:hypothetical protein